MHPHTCHLHILPSRGKARFNGELRLGGFPRLELISSAVAALSSSIVSGPPMDPRRGQAQWQQQQGGGGTFGSSQQQSGQGVQQQGQQQGQQGGQGFSYSYSSSYSSGPGGEYGQTDFSQDKGGGGVEHHHVSWGPGHEPQHHHFSTQGQQGGQQEGGEQGMPEDLAALQQARNAVQMDSLRAVQGLHQRAGQQAHHEAPREGKK
ncbi:unnamed protein product [Closterium sp. Yama58-4]|nr:unnamed protein product [Closterium sp. Yama58-4]